MFWKNVVVRMQRTFYSFSLVASTAAETLVCNLCGSFPPVGGIHALDAILAQAWISGLVIVANTRLNGSAVSYHAGGPGFESRLCQEGNPLIT